MRFDGIYPGARDNLKKMFLTEFNARARYYKSKPFEDISINPVARARIKALPLAEKRYVLFFTPRSGSSRLTSLAIETGVMSQPGEVFNPNFLPRIAAAMQSTGLEDYADMLARARNTQGVFGCEVTYGQMLQSFGSAGRLFKVVKPTSLIWLVREDIVAQAVSGMRMVQTKQGHLIGDAGDREAAEKLFHYHPKRIMGILLRMRWMEWRTERMFAARRLKPLRLSYEQVIAMSEYEVMSLLAEYVGAQPVPQKIESSHRKIGGDKSREFAERFRAENADLMKRLDRVRAPMLAKLDQR